MMEISDASVTSHLAMIRELFHEYAAWLGVDLSFQGFAAELAALPGPYAPPRGRLLLAMDGIAAGCVALKLLSDGACELKRLYVRPPWRRRGLGRRLVLGLIHDARAIGYQVMRLDTLAHMEPALRLYEGLGFQRCGPYYQTPLPDTVFLELYL